MLTTATEFKPTTDTVSLVAFPLPMLAVSVDSVPNPREEDGTWVTDVAEVLSETTEVKLNQLIADLEAQDGSEIAVVTVPNTLPASSTKALKVQLFVFFIRSLVVVLDNLVKAAISTPLIAVRVVTTAVAMAVKSAVRLAVRWVAASVAVKVAAVRVALISLAIAISTSFCLIRRDTAISA